MTKRKEQFRAVIFNIAAWALIWVMGILAIPVGILMLLIYGVRNITDFIIKKESRLTGSRT